MTLRELQTQALQLTSSNRWELVQVLLESLNQESRPTVSQGNLSRLRGIAKDSTKPGESAIVPYYIDELRRYLLTHREDETAFHTYVDRSKVARRMITINPDDPGKQI